MVQKPIWALSMLIVFAVTPAFTQSSANAGRVSIPFQFQAGQKTLPAGSYRITHEGSTPTVLRVSESSKKETVYVKIITRLAREDSSQGGTRLVFDSQGDQRILSEVWLPGRDGFLVYGTAGKHTHEVVKESN